MGIISAIIFGLVAGIVAKMIMPGRDPGGFIITALLGIAGAVIGQFIGSAMGYADLQRWTLSGFLLSVVGALLLLGIYRMIVGRRRVTNRV